MRPFFCPLELPTSFRMLSFLKGRREAGDEGWFSRLKQGLAKTRRQLDAQLSGLFGPGRKLDHEFYDELETVLLVADVGISATDHLLETLRGRARREGFTEAAQL
ncbi:MAG TPA: signal recognition particle receptor subunit alpha, partial [Burkholderiales bacterium]|nr:signal recognition particle receptor subunit alpha [Burkholderiales bacterium]